MKPTIVTKRFFLCPNCNKYEFSYEHLCQETRKDVSKYHWQCSGCNAKVSFLIDPNNEIDITKVIVSKYPEILILLKLEPNDGSSLKQPLHLIVQTNNHLHCEDLEQLCKSESYYYNLHTCPSNYLGGTTVLYGENDDPHGIFKFVEAIWLPEDYDSTDFRNNGGDYSTLFKSLKPRF